MMPNLFNIKFESRDETSPIELSMFLQLFVTTYRALWFLERGADINREVFDLPKEGLLDALSIEEIRDCLGDTRLVNDPSIIEIKQQSPIELAIAGGIGLLFVAAALSGGHHVVKLGPLKLEFNLTSLGESITNLRSALSKNKSLHTGHGFTGARIKLNKTEIFYLNKPTNMNGGFQRFLSQLKIRLNKRSGTLDLSNQDIEQILRYKKNPSKGGFQSRFDKIFNRHFS